MKIKRIFAKPFMCRKTLNRGWVARKGNGRIIWVYEPETAAIIRSNRHLLENERESIIETLNILLDKEYMSAIREAINE